MWTYYKGAKRDPGLDEGATTIAYVPEKGWFWYIPQHNQMVSVGVVAEGKYLTRAGLKSSEAIFKREIEQNLWIKDHLASGQQVGPYYLTSEYSFHSRHCANEGLLLPALVETRARSLARLDQAWLVWAHEQIGRASCRERV